MESRPVPVPRAQNLGTRFVRAAAGQLATMAILAGFVGVWYWGHKTHWAVPGPAAGSPEPPAPRPAPAKPVAGAWPPVRFASAEDLEAAGVQTALARTAELEERVTAPAEVGYNQHRVAQLSSRVPGHVYSIHARLGEAVLAGDLLALIDSEEVGRAKAEYLKEVFLTRYKADVLARYRTVGPGVVPERTVLEAEAAHKEAELRRFTARQRLINLGLTPPDPDAHPASTPKDLARAIQFLGVPPRVVAGFDPRPETANLIPVVAPFAGLVTRQDVVVGEMVTPETAAFVVADVSTMWVNLAVRKEDAGRLRLGQPVRFAATGAAGEFAGALDWIGSEADERTRTVRARCEVANPPAAAGPGDSGRALRANLFGTATVVTGHRPAVVVPDAAVQRMPDGTTLVFVRGPDGLSFEPRPVRVGLARGGDTEVTGLPAGAAVATAGSYVLKSELMKDALVAD